MTDENRRSQGARIRARAQGPKTERLHEIAATMDPEFPDLVDDFVFGTIWSRPGLTFEERMLIAIGALAATGRPDQLRNYLFGALYDGIPPVKVHEAVMMAFVYGGFPNAVTALTAWQEAVTSARAHGLEVDLDLVSHRSGR
jgi:alkylhydroperoxidase/carboxymuconolactone decarboxylase family protein YurZ